MPLRKIECPVCAKQTALLWRKESRLLCDRCFGQFGRDAAKGWTLLVSPSKKLDNQTGSDPKTSFADVASLVSAGTHTGDQVSIQAHEKLLKVLESLIPKPPQVDKGTIDQLAHVRKRRDDLRERFARAVERHKKDQRKGVARTSLHEATRDLSQALEFAERDFERVAKPLRDIVRAQEEFSDETERRIIKRLSDELERRKNPSADQPWRDVVQRVQWRIVERGNGVAMEWEHIESLVERLKRAGHAVDDSRLRFLWEQKPDTIFCGDDEFEGYLAFIFNRVERAILECPIVGNAIYAMDAKEWKTLSRLSKAELMRMKSVRRILHASMGWKRTVQNLLRMKFLRVDDLELL